MTSVYPKDNITGLAVPILLEGIVWGLSYEKKQYRDATKNNFRQPGAILYVMCV